MFSRDITSAHWRQLKNYQSHHPVLWDQTNPLPSFYFSLCPLHPPAPSFPSVNPPILITAVQLILLLSSSFHRRVPQGVRGRLKGGSTFATCLRHIIRSRQSTLAWHVFAHLWDTHTHTTPSPTLHPPTTRTAGKLRGEGGGMVWGRVGGVRLN